MRAIRDRLLEQSAFEAFCEGFTAELTLRRRERIAETAAARREISFVEAEIRKLIQAIKDGASAVSINNELLRLEEKKGKLSAALTELPVPAMHPNMATLFRRKVATLADGLEHAENRDQARQALRGLLHSIVIPAGNGVLQVTGNLGAMLDVANRQTVGRGVANVGCGGGI